MRHPLSLSYTVAVILLLCSCGGGGGGSGGGNNATPAAFWEQRFGTSEHEDGHGLAIVGDTYVVVGNSNHTGAVPNGDRTATAAVLGAADIWAVTTDRSGNLLSNRSYGSSGNNVAYDAIATGDGGMLLVGYTDAVTDGDVASASHGNTDAWVVKLDSDGDVSWEKRYGGAGHDSAKCVQESPLGGWVIGCISSSDTSGDKGEDANSSGVNDLWIFKINASGVLDWERTAGSNTTENDISIAVNTDGSVIAVTNTSGAASGQRSENQIGSGGDAWVVKLSSTGTIDWEESYGSTGYDTAYDVIVDASGYLIAGSSDGPADNDKGEATLGDKDAWLIKINTSGVVQWERIYGGTGNDGFSYISSMSDGSIALGGWTYSIGAHARGPSQDARGESDGWVMVVNASDGAPTWERRIGGDGFDSFRDFEVSSDDKLVFSGRTNSTVSGDITGTPRGSYDYWLVEVSSGISVAPLLAPTLAPINN